MYIFAVCHSTSTSTPPSGKLRNNSASSLSAAAASRLVVFPQSHVIFVHSSVLFLMITNPLTVHFLIILDQTLLVHDYSRTVSGALGLVFVYIDSSPLGFQKLHKYNFLLAFLYTTQYSMNTPHIL